MSLGAWTGWVFLWPQEAVDGNLASIKTPAGVSVMSYKGWLEVGLEGQPKFSLHRGDLEVSDVAVIAERGPLDGVCFAAWSMNGTVGMVGLGCKNTEDGWPTRECYERLASLLLSEWPSSHPWWGDNVPAGMVGGALSRLADELGPPGNGPCDSS